MKKLLLAALAAGTVLAAMPAGAQSVLYRNDFASGTDNMAAALSALGYTVTNTTGNLASYTLSSYGAVVYFNQGNPQPTGDAALLSAYIASGGRVIYDNYTRNAAELPTLNAIFAGSTNQTAITLANSQKLTLSNSGYATFSDGLTALAGGTVAGTFADGTAAIVVGNNGRTIFNGFLTGTLPGSGTYQAELRQVFAAGAVPEPATWGMMILGFATVGGALRRRRSTSVSFA